MGLTSSPSPVDSSGQLDTGELGNLIITGNVTGGKHFRGMVPYQSTRDFRAFLGSASLDSFLRSSAGSEQIGGYLVDSRFSQAGVAQPFYSPSGSVAAFNPATSTVLGPSDVDLRARSDLLWRQVPSEQLMLREISQGQELTGGTLEDIRSTAYQSTRRTPLGSQEPGESYLHRDTYEDRRIAESSSKREEAVTTLQYQERMEQLRRQIERISGQAAELNQALSEPERSSELDRTTFQTADGLKSKTLPDSTETTRPSLSQVPDSITKSQTQRETETPDPDTSRQSIGATELTELEGLQARSRIWSDQALTSRASMPLSGSFDQADQLEQLDSAPPSLGQAEKKVAGGRQLSSSTSQEAGSKAGFDTADVQAWASELRSDQARLLDLSTAGLSGYGGLHPDEQTEPGSVLQEVDQLSDTELSKEAKRVLGSHETYASFAKAKYAQYIQAGWTYLTQGRYYRAVDAYTLASVYKSRDPVAYAGKSLALFAAGEYMSSALFLSRALQILPGYASQEVDIVSILQDRDKLEDRILDAERSLQACYEAGYKTNAGQLQFLLGYVYLQAGRLDQADRAIKEAHEKLGDAPAVAAVKKAISEALSKRARQGRSAQDIRSSARQMPGGL